MGSRKTATQPPVAIHFCSWVFADGSQVHSYQSLGIVVKSSCEPNPSP